MKKILFFLCLFPIVTFAQTEILKRADVILIANDKTALENFLLVKNVLSDKNIEIVSQDKDVFQVRSGIVDRKTSTSDYYVFKCRDNQITMSGFFKLGYNIILGSVASTDNFTPIYNRGMKGSLNKVVFNRMNDFAKTIGSDLSYKVSTDK